MTSEPFSTPAMEAMTENNFLEFSPESVNKYVNMGLVNINY